MEDDERPAKRACKAAELALALPATPAVITPPVVGVDRLMLLVIAAEVVAAREKEDQDRQEAVAAAHAAPTAPVAVSAVAEEPKQRAM